MSIQIINELHDKGYNCSQIVLSLACHKYDLPLNDTDAKLVACAFGGGMQRGETCGCVTGALMAVGLKHGQIKDFDKDAKIKTKEKAREFQELFISEYDSLVCEELLGINISEPANRAKAQESGAMKLCPELMKAAVELLDGILNE